jgi:hypothetical protein
MYEQAQAFLNTLITVLDFRLSIRLVLVKKHTKTFKNNKIL